MAEHSSSTDGPVGGWKWRADKMRLMIEVNPDGSLSDLSGDWSLSAFGVQLDGLSRARLDEVLKAGEGPVACSLGLSDGRNVQLVGAFHEPGQAQGLLIEESEKAREETSPGPDLTPVFQPIISLRDGGVAGFEALARWSDAGQKRPPIKRFEEPALASNMLIRASEALVSWREATGRDDLFMNVNLTGRDLAGGEMANLVEALVQSHDFPEATLRIELTEQAALRDFDEAVAAAKAIKAAGAGLVLDDFGSGHSSFAWLADMPADALKIDPDLTRRLGDPRTETILEAVTLLAGRLGMTVTGEGVEKREDASKLRMLGFDYVQGFAFARPMPADAALKFLKN